MFFKTKNSVDVDGIGLFRADIYAYPYKGPDCHSGIMKYLNAFGSENPNEPYVIVSSDEDLFIESVDEQVDFLISRGFFIPDDNAIVISGYNRTYELVHPRDYRGLIVLDYGGDIEVLTKEFVLPENLSTKELRNDLTRDKCIDWMRYRVNDLVASGKWIENSSWDKLYEEFADDRFATLEFSLKVASGA